MHTIRAAQATSVCPHLQIFGVSRFSQTPGERILQFVLQYEQLPIGHEQRKTSGSFLPEVLRLPSGDWDYQLR